MQSLVFFNKECDNLNFSYNELDELWEGDIIFHQNSDDTFNKIDVILYGQETIGSAERSCDVEEMRNNFYTIENGGYCAKLFELFGKERVEKELEEFLSFDFFPRFGGGIGMTRLARAYEMNQKEFDALPEGTEVLVRMVIKKNANEANCVWFNDARSERSDDTLCDIPKETRAISVDFYGDDGMFDRSSFAINPKPKEKDKEEK